MVALLLRYLNFGGEIRRSGNFWLLLYLEKKKNENEININVRNYYEKVKLNYLTPI